MKCILQSKCGITWGLPYKKSEIVTDNSLFPACTLNFCLCYLLYPIPGQQHQYHLTTFYKCITSAHWTYWSWHSRGRAQQSMFERAFQSFWRTIKLENHRPRLRSTSSESHSSSRAASTSGLVSIFFLTVFSFPATYSHRLFWEQFTHTTQDHSLCTVLPQSRSASRWSAVSHQYFQSLAQACISKRWLLHQNTESDSLYTIRLMRKWDWPDCWTS